MDKLVIYILLLLGLVSLLLNYVFPWLQNMYRRIPNKRVIVLLPIVVLITSIISYIAGLHNAYTGISLPYIPLDKQFMSTGGNGTGNYTCHGQVEMTLQAGDYDPNINKITAVASDKSDELDKINMQVGGTPYGSTLKFDVNTDANAPDYIITENDNRRLSAYHLNNNSWSYDEWLKDHKEYTKSIDVFTLNKTNGMAVWSETNTQFGLSPNPGGFIENLLCY